MSNPKLLPSSRKARVIGLLRPLKDVTVTAGETATFDCELSYEDIPVEWYLKGKKLEPSDKVKSRHLVHCIVLFFLFLSGFLSSRIFLILCSFSCSLLSLSLSLSYSPLISAEIVTQILPIFVGFSLMIFLLKWK